MGDASRELRGWNPLDPNNYDTPSPAECYAELSSMLEQLLRYPRLQSVPWLTWEDEIADTRRQLAELEPLKHLTRWPVGDMEHGDPQAGVSILPA
jgi:hypothetical protein